MDQHHSRQTLCFLPGSAVRPTPSGRAQVDILYGLLCPSKVSQSPAFFVWWDLVWRVCRVHCPVSTIWRGMNWRRNKLIQVTFKLDISSLHAWPDWCQFRRGDWPRGLSDDEHLQPKLDTRRPLPCHGLEPSKGKDLNFLFAILGLDPRWQSTYRKQHGHSLRTIYIHRSVSTRSAFVWPPLNLSFKWCCDGGHQLQTGPTRLPQPGG